MVTTHYLTTSLATTHYLRHVADVRAPCLRVDYSAVEADHTLGTAATLAAG